MNLLQDDKARLQSELVQLNRALQASASALAEDKQVAPAFDK